MIINLYGLVIEYKSDSPELEAEFLRPFKYFQDECITPRVTIKVNIKPPPYEKFSNLKASFVTPRNCVYKNGNQKIIDYSGEGIVIEHKDKLIYEAYSTDKGLLQEICYLLVLSLLGQYCDKKNLLRVHAFSISFKDTAAVIMMPSGGGKSTLLLELLNEDGIKVIAEDTSIVDKNGYLLPFPLPIGLSNGKKAKEIPLEFLWKEKRIEFEDKYRVDLDYWRNKIETRKLQKFILMSGVRTLNGEPYIKKLPKSKIMKSLLRDAVIGIGIYQGLEFILNRPVLDLLNKVPIFSSRLMSAIKLGLSSPSYLFYLSRDSIKNASYLKSFLEHKSNAK